MITFSLVPSSSLPLLPLVLIKAEISPSWICHYKRWCHEHLGDVLRYQLQNKRADRVRCRILMQDSLEKKKKEIR